MVDDAVDHVENAVEITKDISSTTYEKTHEAVGLISDQAVDVYQKVKAKTLDGIDWAEDGLDKISKSLPSIGTHSIDAPVMAVKITSGIQRIWY